MRNISSDTNIWLDFDCIGRLGYPFKLPFMYVMEHSAFLELKSPEGIKNSLLELGLVITELNKEEIYSALLMSLNNKCVSHEDCCVLTLAKSRNYILLTGDNALCKLALKEGIPVIGTLGIFDMLLKFGLINKAEYTRIMQELLNACNKGRRLPRAEIISRLEKC